MNGGMSFSRMWVVVVAVLLSGPSWAQDSGPSPDSHEIRVPEASVESISDNLTIKVGKSTYVIEAPASAERSAYDSLPPEEKTSFLKNRQNFLASLARGLQALRYGFGIGSVVKDTLRYSLRPLGDDLLLSRAQDMPPGVRVEFLEAYQRVLRERAEADEARMKRTFKEKSEEVISSMLRGLDRQLWSQAPLLAHANEFGVMASVGLQALGGVDRKGWGGIFDLGLSVGYNRDSRSVVFQLFRNFERFQSTAMKAVFVAGILGKLGMYIANQKTGELRRQGTTFYPPVIPGFSSSTSTSFSTGLSTGLNIPPPPFGDLLTYSTRLNQGILLRITISPVMPGFIRLQTGFGLHTLKFIIEPVTSAINSARTLTMSRRLCGPVFLK